MTSRNGRSHVCDCGATNWIALKKWHVCIVDAFHSDVLDGHTWRSFESHGNAYVKRTVNGRSNGRHTTSMVLLHAVICKPTPGLVVDHRNGNGLDNRVTNLEPVTAAINGHRQSKKKTSTSKYRGVSLYRGKWRVTLQQNTKQIYLGLFETELAAAAAYDEAVVTVFGSHAIQNFPRPLGVIA